MVSFLPASDGDALALFRTSDELRELRLGGVDVDDGFCHDGRFAKACGMAEALLKFFLSFAQIVKQSSKLTVQRGFKTRSKLFGESGHAVEVIGQRLAWMREDWI